MDFGEEVVSEMCGLDYSLLEEASLNDAMMNVHARVLYIAKVKDIADVDTVKGGLPEAPGPAAADV